MVFESQSSHIGSSLSIVEILVTLYYNILNIETEIESYWNRTDRDRFILSKGHGVLGYYTALVEAGFIPKEDLMSFEKTGSYLLGHPVKNRAKGICEKSKNYSSYHN